MECGREEQTLPGTRKSSLNWALAISLVIHGLILFIPRQSSQIESRSARRIDASLAPPDKPFISSILTNTPPPEIAPAQPRSSKRVLSLEGAKGKAAISPPQAAWSVAEKADMNNFLRELDDQRKAGPNLAQRSLAMARAAGRQQAMLDNDGNEMLERRPDSPPVDPFSLEMYLDGVVKKLNRSADFVKNDPRSRGVMAAKVLVRLNPDGSLQSFKVLNAADQQDEIAYIKSVVERAVPFPAFPPDIQKSAQSLAMLICILPASFGGGGFGFTRTADGRSC